MHEFLAVAIIVAFVAFVVWGRTDRGRSALVKVFGETSRKARPSSRARSGAARKSSTGAAGRPKRR